MTLTQGDAYYYKGKAEDLLAEIDFYWKPLHEQDQRLIEFYKTVIKNDKYLSQVSQEK